MRRNTTRSKEKRDRMYVWLSALTLLIAWQSSASVVAQPYKLPMPTAVIWELTQMVQSVEFWLSIAMTSFRTLRVFAVSMLFGITVGYVSGTISAVEYLLRPLVLLVRATPTVVVILLAFLWIGPESSPELVGVMVIFPIVYTNVLSGIKHVDLKLVEMGKLFQFDRVKMIREIYVPSLGPYIQSAAVSAIGLNLKVMIAAEVICQPEYGLGSGMQIERMLANTAGVIAWGTVAILLAGVLDRLLLQVKVARKDWAS